MSTTIRSSVKPRQSLKVVAYVDEEEIVFVRQYNFGARRRMRKICEECDRLCHHQAIALLRIDDAALKGDDANACVANYKRSVLIKYTAQTVEPVPEKQE